MHFLLMIHRENVQARTAAEHFWYQKYPNIDDIIQMNQRVSQTRINGRATGLNIIEIYGPLFKVPSVGTRDDWHECSMVLQFTTSCEDDIECTLSICIFPASCYVITASRFIVAHTIESAYVCDETLRIAKVMVVDMKSKLLQASLSS